MAPEKMLSTRTETEMPARVRKLLLGAILLLALLLRLLCWHMEPTLSRDGVTYAELIQIWVDGGSFQAILQHWPECWLPPLPLGLVLLLVKCGLPLETAGVGVNIVSGTLIPLLVYRMAKIVTCNNSIALGATLLAAVHPMLIELSIEIQRDTPYLFLIGCTLCFLLEAVRRANCFFWGAGGIFLGLAILTRFESLEFMPVIFCYLAGTVWFKVQSCRTALKQFGILCAGILLACFLASWIMGVPFSYYKIYSGRMARMAEDTFPAEEQEKVR